MMREGKRRSVWLGGLLLAAILCAVGAVMLARPAVTAKADTVAVQESAIVVKDYAQKLDLHDGTTRYCGLYLISIDLGVDTGETAYDIMDNPACQEAQEHILINGKSVKEINATVDDSDYQYGVWPWSMGGVYAVPVFLTIPGGTTTIQVFIHANYLETLGGKLEVTVTGGLAYSKGDTSFSYAGNDVTYVYAASEWYKAGEVPSKDAVEEVDLAAGTAFPGNTPSIWFSVNQPISATVTTYHITEAPSNWNHLANYILINGKSIAAINSSVDDSGYDYTGDNWFMSWAGSTPASTYCQPVFVSTEGNELRVYFHKDFYSTLGKAIVVELLPGFGWRDAGGTVYMNTARETLVIFEDANGSIASVKGTKAEGINAVTGGIQAIEADNGHYFDVEFSENIVTDNQFIGAVPFEYKDHIWAKYVTVDGVALSACDDVRVEVPEKNKVRFYVSGSLADKTIVLKEKMPFASGELLSKEYTVAFAAAPAVDSEERSVYGWKIGDTVVKAGELFGVCTDEEGTLSVIAVYAITYDLGDGENHADNPATYTGEEAITLKAPSKTGYTFVKWVNGSDEEVTVIAAGTKGAVSLTAVWEIIEYTIDYDLDGGDNHADNPTKYTVASEDITLQAPTKSGFIFVKWVDEDGETVTVIAQGSTGNLKLTAVWDVTHYDIIYELDGGQNNANNPATYTGTEEITLSAPTKNGYTFVKWVDEDGETVTVIAVGTTGDITLTAVWEIIEYTITYDLDGGENHADNPTKYTVASGTITLSAPTKAGYEFVMWADDHGSEVTEITAGSTGNITLTAVWVKVSAPAKKSKGCGSAMGGGDALLAIASVLLAGGLLIGKKKIRAK